MVYVMDKISDMTEAQLNNCRNFIPHERLRRMDAYRNIADKKRCASAYMLLVTGMKHEYRKSPPEFVIGEFGKPFFADENNIFFNLSHSGDFAVCAISDQCIGVDVQERINSFDGVDEFFLSVNEKTLLDEAEDPVELFTKIWTVKESYFKYTGMGIPNDSESYDIFANHSFFSEKALFMETHKLERGYVSICSKKKEKLIFLSAPAFDVSRQNLAIIV